MCEKGERRLVHVYDKQCPGDMGRICLQKQICKYNWLKFLVPFAGPVWMVLTPSWVDDGPPTCPPCPQGGIQPAGATVVLCCFQGSRYTLLQPATGPGPVGGAGVFLDPVVPGSTPSVPVFEDMPECTELDAASAKQLLENLQKTVDWMKAQNYPVPDNQNNAINCLQRKMREFGW
jgi:hypothetical protein